MASVAGFRIPPFLGLSYQNRTQCRLRVHSLGGGDSSVLSSDLELVNGVSMVEKREALVDNGNGRFKPKAWEEKKKKKKKSVEDGNDDGTEKLEPFWDDGYGSETMKDYFDAVKEITKPDGGPPRWFSPISCGRPLKGSPILLFLPGKNFDASSRTLIVCEINTIKSQLWFS